MKSQEKRATVAPPPAEKRKQPVQVPASSSTKPGAGDSNGFKMPSVPPPAAKKAGVAPPPGYPGPQEGQPAAKRTKLDTEQADSEDSSLSEDQRKKQRTVFLSNLNFEVDEAEIKELLTSSGPVVEVRLVKHPNGKSKGFAFVEFETMGAAAAAMKRDNEPSHGRPVYISECDPEKKKTFKYTLGIEKNKLFVKGELLQNIREDILRTR